MCELRLDCWFRTRIVEQTRNDVPGTLDRSLARNRAISAAVYQRPMCGISGHVGFAHAEPYFDDLTDGVVDIVSVACQPAAHVQQLAQGIHRAGMVAAADASRSWFPDPRPHRTEQSRAEQKSQSCPSRLATSAWVSVGGFVLSPTAARASVTSAARLGRSGLFDAALDGRGMFCSLRSSARLQERNLRLPLWQKRQTCPPVDHPYSVRLRTGSYASPRCDLPALGYI